MTRRYPTMLFAFLAPLWPLLLQADSSVDQPAAGQAPDAREITQSVLPLEDLRVFTKAYEHIRSSYITEIDDQTLLEHALRGMLDELDPHSTYLDATTFDELQVNTTGEFGGLGIEVGMEDDFVKVVSPIDDTPAERAGIEAGDIIIKIDDTAIKGLTLSESVEKMRGPKGSKVVLTIVREGMDQPLEITLTRDIIKVKSVRSELMEERFAYIRIAQFQVNTGRDMLAELKKLQKQHTLKGIILDLRNNPGGLLQSSVEVADVFLDGGMVVYTEGRMPHSNIEYHAGEGDQTDGLPLIALINQGSASASEIVAGALQDHKRAVILGTPSFGKGSVQTIIPITDDKALKLTTALYFTPNGRSIQAEGIVPDIIAEPVRVTAVEQDATMREAQLARHLDNIRTPADPQKTVAPNTLITDDSQLYQAINLLKGIDILGLRQEGATVPGRQK